MSKSMADTSKILTNGAIFSTLKHTDPHTVRGRSTQKDGTCNEHIFRNGSFRELKIAKESNGLADESALCVQQIGVAKEIKFMMFVYHCNISNPEYHVRRRFDREPSRLPVKKLGKLSSGVDIRH